MGHQPGREKSLKYFATNLQFLQINFLLLYEKFSDIYYLLILMNKKIIIKLKVSNLNNVALKF